MALVSPAKYQDVPTETLEALTKDIVLELCQRLDESALKEKQSNGVQRWLDVRAFVSDIFAETLRDKF